MKEIAEFTRIPIYRGDLHIIFTDDTAASRQERCDLFGECKLDPAEPGASTVFVKSVNGMFFSFDVRHSEIAHECFHLTHRIMEWTNDRFSPKHHEPYAYLNGWLSGFVYHVARLHKIRVRDVWP